MQNIYDKKWFCELWEYCGYLVIEIFYEITWKWTMYFKYISLWAFDVVLPLCHDIGDYPVCVTTMFVWRLVCVTTPSVWWPCYVALGEVLVLKWYWVFYGSRWLICSFIVTLGSLVLQYVYHFCHDVKEIYFVEFKWKFPKF